MDATDKAEAPEVMPEAQERDANADYAHLMAKQQAMAVEMELQAIAARNANVAALMAERDALKVRLAEIEGGSLKRKVKP